MMYEAVTYDVILQRMLKGILERNPNTDTREGSIIYDSVASAAVELQNMYIELDTILDETFGDTASRDSLVRRAAERGITPYPAAYAVLEGEFNKDIPLESRFSGEELNYIATDRISDGKYRLKCETAGIDGNQYSGNVVPIDYIDGLEQAIITKVLIPGEDEEETEALRKRYFSSFATKAYGGNTQDYLEKTNAIPGVGAVRVSPIWDGGGTVKLTLLDSRYNSASTSLVQLVQAVIDPTQDGSGTGVAPIGHKVTVDAAQEVEVVVEALFQFEQGYTFDSLKSNLIEVVEAYLLELRKSWEGHGQTIVRISQIETRIIGVVGVLDIRDTAINGEVENLQLSRYQIPVMGGIACG